MLPHLSPLNGSVAGAPVQVPPPPRFRPIVGPITNIWLNMSHPFRITKGSSGAQKAGVLYEKRVHDFLSSRLPPRYLRNPAIHFQADESARTCIPDGILLRDDMAVVFEIKSQHMSEAWWQLRKLYEPVVRAYTKTKVVLLEVCKSYDSAAPFPEEFTWVDDLNNFVATAKDGELGVMRWKP